MHLFWHRFIVPMADLIDMDAIVEIGSENGDGTEKVARYAAERNAVFHTIDPAPLYDVEDVKARFGETIQIHKSLSLEALPNIGHFNLALIDGDHNWYTVYNELKCIADQHADLKEKDFPLLFFHDISWPYGRRDLYYDVSTIPEEYRHPARRAGITPGRNELVDGRGLNPELLNAEHEGGEKNGVLTAIDDFMEENKGVFDLLSIPISYGFGVMATKARLKANRNLRDKFTYWRSVDGLHEIIRTAEHFRNVLAVVMQSKMREYEANERAPATDNA